MNDPFTGGREGWNRPGGYKNVGMAIGGLASGLGRVQSWRCRPCAQGQFLSRKIGQRSIHHNPLIAEPFFLTRYIEKAGTGILDMIGLCRAAKLRPPEFRQESGQFIQALWRPKMGVSGFQNAVSAPTQSGTPVERLMEALASGEKSSGELRQMLGVKHRPTFRANYLHPALRQGLIETTRPDKPNSRLQKYHLTARGKAAAAVPGGRVLPDGGAMKGTTEPRTLRAMGAKGRRSVT